MAGVIVAVAQTKGGSGKTTLAAHLAVALAGRRPVALLDIDPQGSLGQWYECREERLGEAGTGLTFRTASGWGAKREARALCRDHAVVVVDTPPKSDLEARHAIESALLVAIPIQPTPVDLWATRATLDLVGRGPTPLLVLNRVPARSRASAEMQAAIADLGAAVAGTSLGNRVDFASSMGIGGTVTETAAGGKAAAEIAALLAEIEGRLPAG
jgi:chromosome partitioning protein